MLVENGQLDRRLMSMLKEKKKLIPIPPGLNTLWGRSFDGKYLAANVKKGPDQMSFWLEIC